MIITQHENKPNYVKQQYTYYINVFIDIYTHCLKWMYIYIYSNLILVSYFNTVFFTE